MGALNECHALLMRPRGRNVVAVVCVVLVGLYAATGTIGALLIPAERVVRHHLVLVAAAGLLLVVAPPILVMRALRGRAPRGGFWRGVTLTTWGMLLALGAWLAPDRETRFAWPALALLALRDAPTIGVPASGDPVASARTRQMGIVPSPPSRGSAAVDVKLEGSDLSAPSASALRYVAAWPERNGIAIAIADEGVGCAGVQSRATLVVTFRLMPNLDGGFDVHREVPVNYTISPFPPAQQRGSVAVSLEPLDLRPDAPIRGRVRIDTQVLANPERHLVGSGTFAAVFCGSRHDVANQPSPEPLLADYRAGWRPPPRQRSELSGRFFGAPFSPKGVVARVARSSAGRTELRAIVLADSLADCASPSGAAVRVTPLGAVGGITQGAVPSRVAGTRPGAQSNVLDADNGIAFLEVTSFGETIDGHLTVWSADLKAERHTEISGHFRARVCLEL